ncbi:hypothetical protein SynA1825c_01599 [Synechococcus sp. A18-25c]|nr:hypothetical protein SynA1825c_01599 [Synechococcus sp. A18-25c]
MSDFSPLLIESFEDVPCTEMTGFRPEEIQHHSPLTAKAHAQVPTAVERILQGAFASGALDQG